MAQNKNRSGVVTSLQYIGVPPNVAENGLVYDALRARSGNQRNSEAEGTHHVPRIA